MFPCYQPGRCQPVIRQVNGWRSTARVISGMEVGKLRSLTASGSVPAAVAREADADQVAGSGKACGVE